MQYLENLDKVIVQLEANAEEITSITNMYRDLENYREQLDKLSKKIEEIESELNEINGELKAEHKKLSTICSEFIEEQRNKNDELEKKLISLLEEKSNATVNAINASHDRYAKTLDVGMERSVSIIVRKTHSELEDVKKTFLNWNIVNILLFLILIGIIFYKS